ncbi:hypothetical protein [Marivirga arenosa]|uniref:Nuclear transport factor 2 family protein n=1 Tax=Marivirga arenosa TaxID=3059076 RepID=A0AA51ZWK8_9BACT|nr:hypothetical protein [Marivirga sp. BKB1-2]WNB18138.1 hypothetical protein QYS47_29325 [Marivirga sp. BKB1-2]
MNKLYYILITFILFSFNQNLFSQNYLKDVQSVENIMSALTEVISGPADQERDWERFKFLFSEDAKLIPTLINEEGEISYNYWTPQEYIDMYKKYREGTAFYEQELNRITEEFGNIVHCFSTYAVRTEKNGPVQRRGINSIQILRDKDRYYIMNVFWSNESENDNLTSKYLPKNKK